MGTPIEQILAEQRRHYRARPASMRNGGTATAIEEFFLYGFAMPGESARGSRDASTGV